MTEAKKVGDEEATKPYDFVEGYKRMISRSKEAIILHSKFDEAAMISMDKLFDRLRKKKGRKS